MESRQDLFNLDSIVGSSLAYSGSCTSSGFFLHYNLCVMVVHMFQADEAARELEATLGEVRRLTSHNAVLEETLDKVCTLCSPVVQHLVSCTLELTLVLSRVLHA